MMPPTSWSHQTSISWRTEIAVITSYVPAKTRKKLITAASATNVSPGWMNEMIPVAMKATDRSAESSRHQPLDIIVTPISTTPAASATNPKRIEIALTDE